MYSNPYNAPLTSVLSRYQRFILNKIIHDLDTDKEFNLFAFIENAVSQKCILPSQNGLIIETYYALKEYLLNRSLVIEREEMAAYRLTEKGKQFIACSTSEEFELRELKKDKKSLLHRFLYNNNNILFSFNTKKQILTNYE